MADYTFQKSANLPNITPLLRVLHPHLIQINPNFVAQKSDSVATFYDFPAAFFSTIAKPQRGYSFTLTVLLPLTKTDRRKDACAVPHHASLVANSGDNHSDVLYSERRVAG
ncbi:hypothetical protein QMG90_14360 [Trabulsiella odontotermitis]|uniref:hypothetical protein n=1 Tax=Trabulsiella odontotermitis TaxID=379893 RepID=UPI0024B652EF|nr:hypothetical protein [Trabulsiella odontotermitis]WHP29978.1 hypothetical protein QMG90_14360 [Trabulsiella odontotermitis]